MKKLFQTRTAEAHCDIPCGVYENDTIKHAAETVFKMATKMHDLEFPGDGATKEEVVSYHNTMARYVQVKEEYAHKCKEQILILWTDYFKPKHLDQFPDVHDKVWNATKLCSKAKREGTVEAAKELKAAVGEIADMFEKAEGSSATYNY
ncbi:MAG: Superoxide dismutase [Ni] [Candidatus Marinimicrobia bacterium]|nr:Superoxide dismutase [Ni] [Candidatus Neomarinimicrobiota bacterium]